MLTNSLLHLSITARMISPACFFFFSYLAIKHGGGGGRALEYRNTCPYEKPIFSIVASVSSNMSLDSPGKPTIKSPPIPASGKAFRTLPSFSTRVSEIRSAPAHSGKDLVRKALHAHVKMTANLGMAFDHFKDGAAKVARSRELRRMRKSPGYRDEAFQKRDEGLRRVRCRSARCAFSVRTISLNPASTALSHASLTSESRALRDFPRREGTTAISATIIAPFLDFNREPRAPVNIKINRHLFDG